MRACLHPEYESEDESSLGSPADALLHERISGDVSTPGVLVLCVQSEAVT